MDIIDRYINAVAQALPESRRAEIARELRANLLDSLEEIRDAQGREPTTDEVSGVLLALGHPQQVASSFLPAKQLVSAELFPLYKQSLHFGVILVFILGLIQFAIGFLNSGHMGFISFFHGLMMKGLISFAVITGLFYLFSNPPGGKPLFSPYQCWSPEKLPPISRPWQRISSCEQSVDFANDLFFLLLLNYSLWISAEVAAELIVKFTDDVQQWVPILSVVLIVSLLFGLWNLIYRYWTVPKLLIDACINIASAVILLRLSRLPQIVIETERNLTHDWNLLGVANHIIGVGLFWVGMWLLFMAGWSLYRAWQLTR